MNGSKKYAVVYVRVSSEEQVKGTSLDSQTKACLEYAKQQGFEVPKDFVFREEGESAKLINRPRLIEMLDLTTRKKDQILACIVWKVDRLARQSEHHFIIKSRLIKNGVRIVSVTEPITDDAQGRLFESLLAGFAQFDNEVRALRSVTGLKARTMQGGWPHDPPFGFRHKRTSTGIPTIEPDENAELVKRFLETFSSGAYTVKQSTELAFRLGIRSTKGKKRGWQAIKNMLENPLYAGFVRSVYTDNQLIKGIHKPIIPETTYYKNLEILNKTRKNFSRQAIEDWPLRGEFLKHVCGKAMTGSAPTGRNGPSPRYSCVSCRAKTLGKSVSKKRELVHAEFIELLNSVRPTNGTLALFKQVVLKSWNQEFKESLELAKRLDGEVSELKNRKSRIIDLFIDNKITDEQKNQKIDEVEAEIGNRLLQQADAKNIITDQEQVIDQAISFMQDPARYWNLSDIEVKKRLQDLIFPHGLVYDFDEGFRTADVSKAYLLTKQLSKSIQKNPILVGASRTYWNQIKADLLSMYQITESINMSTLLGAEPVG